MLINLGFIGFKKVQQAVPLIENRVAIGVQRGLVRCGLHLRRESMSIVPVDTGQLKSTAWTRITGGSGKSTVVGVGYRTDYAVPVHDDPTKAHGRLFNIKHAKRIASGLEHARGEEQQLGYLIIPAYANRANFRAILADSIKTSLTR